MSDLYLKQIEIGPMANFAYLIGSKSLRQCFVVDPAWDLERIEEAALVDDMKITGALVTHYHPDHCGGHLWGHDIAGIAELVGKWNIPVYANEHEVSGICLVTGLSKSDIRACRGGDELELGGVKITLIHTPGHTPGSQCFLCQEKLISGDTLFLTGCGRVDLPGGNSEQLYDTITQKLNKLPPETVVYPGHHYDEEGSATLAKVQKINPYLRADSPQAWRRLFGRS